MTQLKVFLFTLLMCGILLYSASITIFKQPDFYNTHVTYDTSWKCAKYSQCWFYIYPNATDQGIRYVVPAHIIQKIVEDYMKQKEILYSQL